MSEDKKGLNGNDLTDDENGLVSLHLIPSNYPLKTARLNAGLSRQDIAAKIHVTAATYGAWETLVRIPPENRQEQIAVLLNLPIDYLFPVEITDAVKAGVFRKRTKILTTPEVISLTDARLEKLSYDEEKLLGEGIDNDLLKIAISKVLRTMKDDKEIKVITLRFGLEDGRSRTLEEVGAVFGVTGARIRQIEMDAIRKLRHPTRLKYLKPFFEPE